MSGVTLLLKLNSYIWSDELLPGNAYYSLTKRGMRTISLFRPLCSRYVAGVGISKALDLSASVN